jgi:hypothetical protein
MVARRAHNPKVVGSNPAPATNFQGSVLTFSYGVSHEEVIQGFVVRQEASTRD